MDRLDRNVPFLSDRLAGRSRGAFDPTLDTETQRALAFSPDGVRQSAARLRARSLATAGLVSEEMAAQPDLSFEVIVERSNLLPSWFLSVGAERSRAICKIEASGRDFLGRVGNWAGTGFLVTKDILLTNCHVLSSIDVARNATAVFAYELDDQNRPNPTRTYRINPERLFLASPVRELDFAFVWVDGEPGRDFGSVPLSRSAMALSEKDYVNIIQHPAGRLKEVALQDNTVTRVDNVTVLYTTDTEPGSSGSCAFDNRWMPVALHHASRSVDGKVQNEGILLSAIAAHLDKLAEHGDGLERDHARTVLRAFGGSDELLGFFGSLGRSYGDERPGLERVVDSYRGEADDIDVAFWNIEWFCKEFREKVPEVAEVIVRMNLDIWSLAESSPAAAETLVDHLNRQYGLDFGWAASEPEAGEGKQSTTVIWNKRTVSGERLEWPPEVQEWLKLRSNPYQPGDFVDLGLEAIDGKIFDRHPGLFRFAAKNRDPDQDEFSFFVVPVHLKAMAEGSKRRQLASEILAAAIDATKRTSGYEDEDWIVGGDFNAELATEDFQSLAARGLSPVSASDEANGGFTYLKSPKSLIDHVFLSASLSKLYGAGNYFVVAREKELPGYVKRISDHRPVVVRLSLHDQQPAATRDEHANEVVFSSLQRALHELSIPRVVSVEGRITSAATGDGAP